jgi:hypothetical protein
MASDPLPPLETPLLAPSADVLAQVKVFPLIPALKHDVIVRIIFSIFLDFFNTLSACSTP